MSRKLRMGMVGGGPGGFIGNIHRKAAMLTGEIELVCGAFSSRREKSREMGRQLYLEPNRVYDSFRQMIEHEAVLPIPERMDFVSIVTPNYLHYPVAKYALEKGFPVICDKPLTIRYEESRELAAVAEAKSLPFAVTYVYSGYPMVKEARTRVLRGDLGKIRKVIATYTQGGLSKLMEAEKQKKPLWRLDPVKGGKAGSIGDIGTHAEHIVRYITGLAINEVYADLHITIAGRKIFDDGNILVHLDNGANGVISLSQVASGEKNNLAVAVYGERGSLEWKQQEPNSLVLKWGDRPSEQLKTGLNSPAVESDTLAATILPAGHPEGFIEAFSNIYRGFVCTVRRGLLKEHVNCSVPDYPEINDGVAGMAFIEAALQSTEAKKWIKVKA